MSRWLGNNRLAADAGFVGAVVGFAISLVMFVVLFGLSVWLDSKGTSRGGVFSSCLLRLIALLGLTLGMGIGYLTARSMGG